MSLSTQPGLPGLFSGEEVSEATARARMSNLPWSTYEDQLNAHGFAVIEGLFGTTACSLLRDLYRDESRFRKRVVMHRHGYGQGEYQYFRYPLPQLLQAVRTALYPNLAAIANRWQEALKTDVRFPEDHADYLAACHAAGQAQATPLVLRYESGDYNRLHQDLYGEWVFPMQVAVLLSKPVEEFSGGEFILSEQRPRLQTRAHVVPLGFGDAVIFPVHHRPGQGVRGYHRLTMRHGVSTVRTGHRFTLGIIFHDAAK